MTTEQILKGLEFYTGRLPKKAIKAAVQQQEAITPELLRVIHEAAKNPVNFAERQDYMLHVFALFLLAQFRERGAYRPVLKMFAGPGETAFDLAGDVVTENLKNILGSIYDGDPAPLKALIENAEGNEYVRNAGLQTFVVLAHSGQMPREDVVRYYRSLFHGKLSRTDYTIWTWLVNASADLPAPELMPEIRQVFAEDLINEIVSNLEDIEHDIVSARPHNEENYSLITDAISEMERWATFH